MTAHVCSCVLYNDLEFFSSFFDNKQNKLGLSCAKLRPASLLNLLLLENLELSTSSEVNKEM